MQFLKKIPVHPFILAPYPVLALAASNFSWVRSLEFYWALAATYLAMLFILAVLWLLVRNLPKAAAVTTLIIFLFFTYGHVYNLFAKDSNPTFWLTILWSAILIGGMYWVLSRPNKMQDITLSLNRISLLLLLFPLFTLGGSYIRDLINESQQTEDLIPPTGEMQLNAVPATLPDIYFIVLDGYARSDILAEIYDYDNQPLMQYLSDHDFYVADESIANYHHTVLSLSTTLNMSYVKDLLSAKGVTSYDYWKIMDLIHENQVFELSSQAGYELVVFDSGQSVTNIHQADHYLRPVMKAAGGNSSKTTPKFSLGLFETKLLETTALRPLLPTIFANFPEDSRYENQRQFILNTFSNLSNYAREDGDYFIFAYILSPHPPFVFDANGESKANWRPYTVSDGSHWVGGIGTRDEYIAGYRDQIQYVNTLLINTIDEILAQSETPPIIIIQGDHGPGAYFEWQSLDQTNLHERLTILNAIYLPGSDDGWLYPSISPINTFKVVFNRYFGGNFELSEDRAFFSKWGRPFEFTEVTKQVREPSSP